MSTATHRHRKVHKVLRVTGGRVAYTNTSRVPDRDVELALRALAKDVDLARVVVHVKRIGEWSSRYGNAYPIIPSIANMQGLRRAEWRYLIVASDGRGPGGGWTNTLAHEAKHERWASQINIRHYGSKAGYERARELRLGCTCGAEVAPHAWNCDLATVAGVRAEKAPARTSEPLGVVHELDPASHEAYKAAVREDVARAGTMERMAQGEIREQYLQALVAKAAEGDTDARDRLERYLGLG